MILNKLESGLLLFQTQQGLVAVEPTFWQRVYLLWTFRNFRQLSLPLLNPRQTALIHDLFRRQTVVVSHEFEPSLEIGVVQDFVPPAIEIGAALEAEANASPAVNVELAGRYYAPADFVPLNVAPLDVVPVDVAPRIVPIAVGPIAVEPAMMSDALPVVEKERAEIEGTQIDRAEFAPSKALDRSFAPSMSWPSRSWPIMSWLRPASSNPGSSKPASSIHAASNLAASEEAASQPHVPRIAIFRLAAAVGALSLCAFFIFAFHRIGDAPGPQAHSSPQQINAPDPPADPPSAPEPTPVAENPASVPDGPAQAGDGPGDAPDAGVEPAPEKEASSIPATHRMTTPERTSHGETGRGDTGRGDTARVASRSRGGQHIAALSRVPASTLKSTLKSTSTPTSTRRATLAPASREAMGGSAQSYFDLANQQMRKGNYAAASANYKRAWRIEENHAAASSRLVRTRRTMQAENESLPNRR